MVSVLTSTGPALSQRPVTEQPFYIYGAPCYSAAAITVCLEMKAVDEENRAIVKKKKKKRGQAQYQMGVEPRYDLSLK